MHAVVRNFIYYIFRNTKAYVSECFCRNSHIDISFLTFTFFDGCFCDKMYYVLLCYVFMIRSFTRKHLSRKHFLKRSLQNIEKILLWYYMPSDDFLMIHSLLSVLRKHLFSGNCEASAPENLEVNTSSVLYV